MRPVEKISCHHCGSFEISLDNVVVPKENLIGTRGQAYREIMTVLNPERIGVAMLGVGAIAAIYEYCMRYVRERHAFGGPIGRFQSLQHYLADMCINLENARNLTYKAAWLCDTGQPFHLEAAMAKLVAAEGAAARRHLRHRDLRRLRHLQRVPGLDVRAGRLPDPVLAHLQRDEPQHAHAVPGPAEVLGLTKRKELPMYTNIKELVR